MNGTQVINYHILAYMRDYVFTMMIQLKLVFEYNV